MKINEAAFQQKDNDSTWNDIPTRVHVNDVNMLESAPKMILIIFKFEGSIIEPFGGWSSATCSTGIRKEPLAPLPPPARKKET